jgi:hypothetical protein
MHEKEAPRKSETATFPLLLVAWQQALRLAALVTVNETLNTFTVANALQRSTLSSPEQPHVLYI